MARHLSLAEREDMSARAYELSLEGLSFRAVGEQLGVSHPTAASLVREEAERRRRHAGASLQKMIDMQMKAINRLWDELGKSPSPHSVANLAHALRGLLQDTARLTGIVPPDRVQHQHSMHLILSQAFQSWYPRLTDNELHVLQLLTQKAQGGGIEVEEDVVLAALEKYQRDGYIRNPDAPIEISTGEPEMRGAW